MTSMRRWKTLRTTFDVRLLVAQAMCEDMTLISRDRILAGYPVPVLW